MHTHSNVTYVSHTNTNIQKSQYLLRMVNTWVLFNVRTYQRPRILSTTEPNYNNNTIFIQNAINPRTHNVQTILTSLVPFLSTTKSHIQFQIISKYQYYVRRPKISKNTLKHIYPTQKDTNKCIYL